MGKPRDTASKEVALSELKAALTGAAGAFSRGHGEEIRATRDASAPGRVAGSRKPSQAARLDPQGAMAPKVGSRSGPPLGAQQASDGPRGSSAASSQAHGPPQRGAGAASSPRVAPGVAPEAHTSPRSPELNAEAAPFTPGGPAAPSALQAAPAHAPAAQRDAAAAHRDHGAALAGTDAADSEAIPSTSRAVHVGAPADAQHSSDAPAGGRDAAWGALDGVHTAVASGVAGLTDTDSVSSEEMEMDSSSRALPRGAAGGGGAAADATPRSEASSRELVSSSVLLGSPVAPAPTTAHGADAPAPRGPPEGLEALAAASNSQLFTPGRPQGDDSASSSGGDAEEAGHAQAARLFLPGAAQPDGEASNVASFIRDVLCEALGDAGAAARATTATAPQDSVAGSQDGAASSGASSSGRKEPFGSVHQPRDGTASETSSASSVAGSSDAPSPAAAPEPPSPAPSPMPGVPAAESPSLDSVQKALSTIRAALEQSTPVPQSIDHGAGQAGSVGHTPREPEHASLIAGLRAASELGPQSRAGPGGVSPAWALNPTSASMVTLGAEEGDWFARSFDRRAAASYGTLPGVRISTGSRQQDQHIRQAIIRSMRVFEREVLRAEQRLVEARKRHDAEYAALEQRLRQEQREANDAAVRHARDLSQRDAEHRAALQKLEERHSALLRSAETSAKEAIGRAESAHASFVEGLKHSHRSETDRTWALAERICGALGAMRNARTLRAALFRWQMFARESKAERVQEKLREARENAGAQQVRQLNERIATLVARQSRQRALHAWAFAVQHTRQLSRQAGVLAERRERRGGARALRAWRAYVQQRAAATRMRQEGVMRRAFAAWAAAARERTALRRRLRASSDAAARRRASAVLLAWSDITEAAAVAREAAEARADARETGMMRSVLLTWHAQAGDPGSWRRRWQSLQTRAELALLRRCFGAWKSVLESRQRALWHEHLLAQQTRRGKLYRVLHAWARQARAARTAPLQRGRTRRSIASVESLDALQPESNAEGPGGPLGQELRGKALAYLVFAAWRVQALRARAGSADGRSAVTPQREGGAARSAAGTPGKAAAGNAVLANQLIRMQRKLEEQQAENARLVILLQRYRDETQRRMGLLDGKVHKAARAFAESKIGARKHLLLYQAFSEWRLFCLKQRMSFSPGTGVNVSPGRGGFAHARPDQVFGSQDITNHGTARTRDGKGHDRRVSWTVVPLSQRGPPRSTYASNVRTDMQSRATADPAASAQGSSTRDAAGGVRAESPAKQQARQGALNTSLSTPAEIAPAPAHADVSTHTSGGRIEEWLTSSVADAGGRGDSLVGGVGSGGQRARPPLAPGSRGSAAGGSRRHTGSEDVDVAGAREGDVKAKATKVLSRDGYAYRAGLAQQR